MNPSSNPQGNFDDFVRDTVQQELAKQGKAPAATPPEPLTLNVGGQVFSYANRQDLEAALNNFVGATGQKFAELQSQIEQGTGHQQQQGAYVTGQEAANQWDDAEFVKRMTESPREGLKYWLNNELFEGKSQDPITDLKDTITKSELTNRSIAAYQFKENHPEFPGGADFAQKIEQIRQQMGLPYDVNGLDAAYLVGMQRGFLPNFYQIQQQQQQAQALAAQQGQTTQEIPWGNNPQQWNQGGPMSPQQFNGGFGQNGNFNPNSNPYLAAPPGVNRNSNFQGQGNVNYDDLSVEQIESIFARAGKPVR